MTRSRGPRVHERWAHSVIGQLLAAPPAKGELRAAIASLAARQWRHPGTGEPVSFGFSTIERWYYRALKERTDPVGKLRRKRRADAGQQPAMSEAVRHAVLVQYAAHKSWSARLHHDNLIALSEKTPELRPVPSYSTLRRFLKAHGLAKQRRLTSHRTAGAARAEARLLDREVRSYEAEYVGGVWHWDCHVGSKKVLTPRGEWQLPVLFGVLDDRSRLACLEKRNRRPVPAAQGRRGPARNGRRVRAERHLAPRCPCDRRLLGSPGRRFDDRGLAARHHRGRHSRGNFCCGMAPPVCSRAASGVDFSPHLDHSGALAPSHQVCEGPRSGVPRFDGQHQSSAATRYRLRRQLPRCCKRIALANCFCVPHNLQAGQKLHITCRSAGPHVPDALGLVDGIILRPVLHQGVLGRVLVIQASLLVPPSRDGEPGHCIAGWGKVKLGRIVCNRNGDL
jgi:hypothetical protein